MKANLIKKSNRELLHRNTNADQVATGLHSFEKKYHSMNATIIRFLGTALLCFGLNFSFAQQSAPDLPSEQISYSLPKSIYFVGEKLWVEIQAQSGTEPAQSQIAYVELLNRYNESVALGKFQLEKGRSLNYLELPAKLPSDQYLLRVFTRVSPYLDLEEGLKQEFVTIFNPNFPPKVAETREVLSLPADKITPTLTGPKSQKQVLDLSVASNQIQEVKISVWNPFLASQSQLSSREIYSDLESRLLVPELFGHLVEGKINGVADTTQLYYLSVHGEKSSLFTDRPDAKGSLFFDTGGMKNWDFMVAQALGNKALTDLSIVSPAPKTTFAKNFRFPELVISPEDRDLLAQLLKGGQVEGYFYQQHNIELAEVVTGFVEDRTYRLDDYTRFDKVETVIKEYVPEVSIRTVARQKEFRMLDEVQESKFNTNPLMLVDAMPVFDSDRLAQFDPKGFEKLEILSRTFYLNEEAFPGVLSFRSYKNDFGGFEIPTNGVYLDYQGIAPIVSQTEGLFAKPNNPKLQDWRTILYWSVTQPQADYKQIELEMADLDVVYLLEVQWVNSSGQTEILRQAFRPE
ncbi:hypothetical protein [Algoriphagus namhaensis]